MIEYETDPIEGAESTSDQYDSPWKGAIELYFPEFMAFYFPDASAEIDWSKEHVFLDQELRAVVRDAELGTRLVDRLVRVNMLSGDESWIYIHIEVQGTKQVEFAKRMFVYNNRIFDRYDKPVASLAVLADENRQWKPASYGFSVLGCKHTLEFPVAKLTDYDGVEDELLASDNAFGLITAAHILTRQTRKQHQERYEAKVRLVRILYERHWDKQRVINLFGVLDWLMKLPPWLNSRVFDEIETIEEREKVEYITSVERIGLARGMAKGMAEGMAKGMAEGMAEGMAKGMAEGMAEGMAKGMAEGMAEGMAKGITEGRVEGASRLLRRLLERRFGVLPEWATERLTSASEEVLEAWGEAVLTAPTLEAVFK